MTVTVYDFPQEWYELIVTQKFRTWSRSFVSPRPFTGGVNVNGSHTKLWRADVTMGPQRDLVLQEMKAFFDQLDGQAGVLRFADVTRLAPWHDRALAPSVSYFSDASSFTDGTGFANGYLPPEVYLASAAQAGSKYIVLGGFPASTANVLRRGDLLQIKPNGIPGTVPHLYAALLPGSSDADGNVGIKIDIGLRTDVAARDTVGLRYASSLFRLADDTQGEIEDSDGVGTFGFSIIEALDLVP